MKHKSNIFEAVVHGIFLILGLITVGCVLLITIYLIMLIDLTQQATIS